MKIDGNDLDIHGIFYWNYFIDGGINDQTGEQIWYQDIGKQFKEQEAVIFLCYRENSQSDEIRFDTLIDVEQCHVMSPDKLFMFLRQKIPLETEDVLLLEKLIVICDDAENAIDVLAAWMFKPFESDNSEMPISDLLVNIKKTHHLPKKGYIMSKDNVTKIPLIAINQNENDLSECVLTKSIDYFDDNGGHESTHLA